MSTKPHIWLRAEHKALEQRAAVTPDAARQLREAGYPVTVEDSAQRVFSLQQYVNAGCQPAAEHSWRDAPADAIIIGLKELSPELGPFQHRHVHFAHVYKYQHGWREMLQQFSSAGGQLYDLEYLVDENGRRVAAFGYWAGYVGAAIALMSLAAQQSGQALGKLQAWPDRAALQQQVNTALAGLAEKPSVLVIGALGRSGKGAVELCKACGIEASAWDQAETAVGGPFDAVASHDVLVNCVFLNQPVPAFTTISHLEQQQRSLAVIADVSCDPYSDLNPLPIYNSCTTLLEPTLRVLPASADAPPLDVISIDHLPSLLPVESSNEFSTQLMASLLALDTIDQGVWQRALQVFDDKSAEARGPAATGA